MKLHFEPKVKPPVSDNEYAALKDLIRKAQDKSKENNVYLELEKGENSTTTRKQLNYVAEKEGIALKIRVKRGSNFVQLIFTKVGDDPFPLGKRVSAKEACELIVKALASSKAPLPKSQILSAVGISQGTWNIRIRELLADKKVTKVGTGRDTKYELG